MTATAPIRLLVSDVDGTLIRHDKTLTPRSIDAVHKLRAAGIRFTIISSRPPKGIKALIDRLEVVEPFGGFNGALLVKPDLTPVAAEFLDPEAARRAIEVIASFGIDVWLYSGQDWFVPNRHGFHVDHESKVVNIEPAVPASFNDHLDRVGKIVAVSTDAEKMNLCEAEIASKLGDTVSATRSQTYYIDITSPSANKGNAVVKLSQMLGIPTAQIATIGDMFPDVLMFRKSGLSIAMGNAKPDVQREATYVTSSNEEEGFAKAMEQFVLGSTEASRSAAVDAKD